MNNDQQYSRLDIAFSKFMAQRTALDKSAKDDFENIIANLSFQQSQGHSCIKVNAAEKKLIKTSNLAVMDSDLNAEILPLVLEQDRLYLHRYWLYESRLARQIKALIRQQNEYVDYSGLLDRYFVQLIDETDWQREAAGKVLGQTFSIITGGPGTGKTTLVVKILALLQEIAAQSEKYLHIALVAPTGKAALRLQDSIGLSKQTLPCSESIKQNIPETVATIHRLLGPQGSSPYFKYDAKHPLPYDLVVVDEASMVDLALMSKLLDALKVDSRLILLGDKDQLASVESGAVLADLTSSLPAQTLELKKSYRFQQDIKKLADAINSQAVDKAWQILQSSSQTVSLLNQDLIDYIVQQYQAYLDLVKHDAEIVDVFKAFNQFRVLCSNRFGENGVLEINQRVEQQLAKLAKITMNNPWYSGRPVMVTQNNPSLRIYNGDIGICMHDPVSLKNAVYFLRSDGTVKKVLPSRLSFVETVYAMTIHKAQGSEFEHCLCVLAAEINPVLSKELIYTAVTRAKNKLKIYAEFPIFSHALQQKVERAGGLSEKLGNKQAGLN